MKRKLGIFCECLPNIPVADSLRLIKEAGFECYAVSCSEYGELSKIIAVGDELGMSCELLRAPIDLKLINSMWERGVRYILNFNLIKKTIDAASAAGVPVVAVRVSNGWYPPEMNELGLSRFDDLVIYAGEKGVKLAFENVYSMGNLAYLGDRYDELDHVGLCYDCGHEHCFTKDVSWLDIFPRKTFAVHINDNTGRGEKKEGNNDTHSLPFDGDIDYETMMRKLDRNNYEGSLILDVSKRGYDSLGNEEYLALAFERLEKVSEMGQ